jgi:EAL domain-containing protein (putative c-di-GMP-specific phosphodiesterase class I)
MEKQKWYEEKDEHSYKWSTLSRELVKEDIASGYFSAYLQPKVDYTTGKFYGAEALVRYGKKDNLANVIDRLEKTKTIKYVDMFILEEVCKMFVSWKEKNIPFIPVSCNFSRISLFEIGMPEKINEIVESYGVPKNMIEIEITESVGELEQDMAYRISKTLHDFGFRIAMDDFGTMYSNLSIIESMRFDVIKLDRSMVYNIDRNEVSRKILKHMINMCNDIGIECIAEGVETETQAEFLKEMGCTHIQGFLYSKPVDIKTFEELYIKNLIPE